MIRYQLHIGSGRSSSVLTNPNHSTPLQNQAQPELNRSESLDSTSLLSGVTENLKLIPTLFNIFVKPSVSHFFHEISQDIFTPQFAVELGVGLLTGAIGGKMGRAAGSLFTNPAFCLPFRAFLTHLGMSRSNEILTALLQGQSIQWSHLIRLDHQDLLGTFNVAVGEVLGARVERSLSIRSRATQFIGGRIGGGLTMSFSSFLELGLGNVLGWTHEDPFSHLSAKAITKSIFMDAGFRLGHTLFALPFSNSQSAYAERLRSRADLRQIERQDLRQAGREIVEGARQAPYILVGLGMGMGAGALLRPRTSSWDCRELVSSGFLKSHFSTPVQRGRFNHVMNTIDASLGVVECMGADPRPIVERLQDTSNRDGSGVVALGTDRFMQSLSPKLVNHAFEKYRQALDEISERTPEAQWEQSVDHFLLYMMADDFSFHHLHLEVSRSFQEKVAVRRALVRHAQQGVAEARILELRDAYERGEIKYEDILREHETAIDPFEALSTEIPESLRSYPLDWLKAHPEIRPIVRTLARLKDLGRVQELREVMGQRSNGLSHITLSERLPSIRAYGLHQDLEVQNMRHIHDNPERAIIWNPYTHEAREGVELLLSPTLGEVEFVRRVSDDRIEVRVDDKLITCLDKNLVRVSDVDAYRAELARRRANYTNLPIMLTPFVLNRYLSPRDPAFVSFDTGSRHRLWTEIGKPSGENSRDLISQLERGSGDRYNILGIDPVAFAIRMAVGENPGDFVSRKPNAGSLFTKRVLTPDMVREFLLAQPWRQQVVQNQAGARPNALCAGNYYPEYYPRSARRPRDLTKLYFDFRARDPEAIVQTREALQPLVDQWMRHESTQNGLLVPMIGTAPLREVAEGLGYETLFPWLSRPRNYGQGVEGQRAIIKMRMVQAALKLHPDSREKIKDRDILLVDDNGTDWVTYIWARNLFFEAGARSVGIVTLTNTIRNIADLII